MNSLTLKENTTMKKIYRYSAIYALALSFALNTSSCSDFLQVEPTGSLTEEQVFEKIDNVEPLVLGLYKSYRGCKEGRNGLMPYLGTDETQKQRNYLSLLLEEFFLQLKIPLTPHCNLVK